MNAPRPVLSRSWLSHQILVVAKAGQRGRRSLARAAATVAGPRARWAWVCAVAIAVSVTTGLLTPASAPAAAPTVHVQVAAPVIRLVCPAGVVLPEDVNQDSEFSAVPVSPTTQVDVLVSGDGELQATSLGGQELTIAGTVVSLVPEEPALISLRPGATPTQVVATAVTEVTQGDLRGLVAGTCQAPDNDIWLVGASTEVGATAQLVLSNPGMTPAQVSWSMWGTTGPVDGAVTQAMVPPGSTRVVNLAAGAGVQRALSVRVQSHGGQVSAFVQQSWLDGYTPAGVDRILPSVPPSLRQTVAAVVPQTSTDPQAVVLQLVLPGEDDAVANVQVLGPQGPIDLPDLVDLPLNSQSTLDVPLGGLAAGRYTVVVDSSQPVAAALTFQAVGLPGELDPVARVERALVASTAGGSGLLGVPAGTANLVVGAVGRTDAAQGPAGSGQVELLGVHGEVLQTRDLHVDAGTTGMWDIGDLLQGQPGQDVAAIKLVADEDGAVLVWGLLVEREQDDGTLVSMLEPAPVAAAAQRVQVWDDAAVVGNSTH